MTIPSTPAKGKALPVRYVGILRTASEVGSYHTTNAVSDMNLLGDLRHYDVYTLIPPHLAEQWEELRKAKRQAEKRLNDDMEPYSTGHGYIGFEIWNDWVSATHALADFEKQHSIGGAA